RGSEVFAQREMIDAFEVSVAAPQVTGDAIGTGLGKGIDEALQCKGPEWNTVGVSLVGINQFIFVNTKRCHDPAIEAGADSNEHGPWGEPVLDSQLGQHMLTPKLLQRQRAKHPTVRVDEEAD